MDADAKKTALRMIPYGIYVLTSEGKDGKDGKAKAKATPPPKVKPKPKRR